MQKYHTAIPTKESITKYLSAHDPIHTIIQNIIQAGGQPFLVGGAVRDIVLGKKPTDLDVEIHNMLPEAVKQIMAPFGFVNTIGKSFGVMRVGSLDVDWSLPRSDSTGRKPIVAINPLLGIVEALRRRDLTMNAMAIDLTSYELIDPFGGLHDLNHSTLRTPDPSFFVQDPLRFYRVMQFVGRFTMYPDNILDNLCATMDLHDISNERISDEYEKLLLLSPAPSQGFRWLKGIGRLESLLPEIAALIDIPQNPQWHPEGDVFEHTMQAIDAAAKLTYIDEHEKLMILFAALCHDLGKATSTQLINGIWKSIGHAQEGIAPTKELLYRMTIKKNLILPVTLLVAHHMAVIELTTQQAGPGAYKRLAKKLAGHVNLHHLALLARAESRARNPLGNVPLIGDESMIDHFVHNAQHAMVLTKAETPILRGRDIIAYIPPGKLLGSILSYVYAEQIEHNIHDKEILKELALQQYKKLQKKDSST